VNFDVQEAQLALPYDFLSIMHYRRNTFSANGEDTIVPKPAYMQFIDVMGNVDRISDLDAQAVAWLYGKP
jgi:hypothetical protein